MHIGPMRLEHRARLATLLVATKAFNADEVHVALSLFDLSLAAAADGGRAGAEDAPLDYEFIGAFDDEEQLMGYASFGPAPSAEGTWDLYWLAVDPAAQGRGYGRALVERVNEVLTSRGARLIIAETSGRPDYAATRAFYLATGYLTAATVKDFYAPGDDRILLHKRLTTRERGVATR